MTTRSSTAPAGNFLPVSIVISLIALVAMLFVVLQTEDLPIFPANNSASYGPVRTPFFRGLIHIPEFRWAPLFRSPAPDMENAEDHMPQSERIDRWSPFIKEASDRFQIPERWIRTIIQIESGGRTMLWGRPITSGAGAMGVMQLMHDTYSDMSARNGLGADPYNVHDNILAGTAYLRELYNRYGYPRLFAAYNAGPGVLEAHMQHGARLPAETRNYIRLALAGTTTAELATKLMQQILPKASPAKTTAAVAKPSPPKASAVKIAMIAIPQHKPVRVATLHSAAKSTHAGRPAKPARVAAHVASRATHAAATRAILHHR